MAGPSAIITLGLGGTPSDIITLGLGSGTGPPVIPPTGGGGVNISVTLTDAQNNPLPNLTGLRWSWWDETVLDLQGDSLDEGYGAFTNASGLFSVTSISGSSRTPGQEGWITITDSTGVSVAAGKITVH